MILNGLLPIMNGSSCICRWNRTLQVHFFATVSEGFHPKYVRIDTLHLQTSKKMTRDSCTSYVQYTNDKSAVVHSS